MNELSNIFEKASDYDKNDKKSVKENGVVFTNKNICDIIIEKIEPNITDTICEPSVGKGAFVFSLLEYFRRKHDIDEIKFFVENNLFCFDINEDFIIEFKLLLLNYFSLFNINELKLDNIKCEDFLLSNKGYDVIIGNPPYIRIQNLNKEYLSELKKSLKSVSLGNIDLYYAFLEKALDYSKKVGFIIPNSFIKNKSGKFIRDIIKERLNYIYDFENDKIWNDISTYTCILICSYENDDVLYQTKSLSINMDKKSLGDDKWIFNNKPIKENGLLNSFLNYYNCGLATLKDDVFKIKTFDDEYCYIDDYKIEKNICKKYIKGTKDRTFNDYKYIIYPYDENNNIYNEDFLKNNYPLCYDYLLKNKEVLLNRENGKTNKYITWYCYGRKQGLLKNKIGKQIILPLCFLETNGFHYINIPDNENVLVLSGILVDIKPEHYNGFINSIMDKTFYKYLELNNKTLPNSKTSEKWLTLTTKNIKNY